MHQTGVRSNEDPLLAALFDTIPDPVFACDSSGRIRKVSRSAENLTRSHPLLQRLEHVLPLQLQSENPLDLQWFERALAGEKVSGVVAALLRQGAERRIFVIQANPAMVSGEPGALVILRERDGQKAPVGDIAGGTGKGKPSPAEPAKAKPAPEAKSAPEATAPAPDRTRRSETEIQQAERLESIGRIAGGVAHEFNNVLTTVAGFAELALAELDPAHPAYGYLQTIQSGGVRLGNLTRQLLAHTRTAPSTPREVSLNDVLTGMDSLARRTLREDTQLELVLEPHQGHVRIDVTQFEQLVLQVLVMMRDALPRGGKVTIATKDSDVREAGRNGPPPGTYGVVTLRDDGTREKRGRLLESFRPSREVGKADGPQLAATHALVVQLGGHLDVEGEIGRGGIFRIWLPLLGRPVLAVPSSPINHADWRAEGTVLLVEDETAVRRFVADILQLKGYTVLEASNGAEALQVQAAFPGHIDILLTDVAMPVMGGRELTEKLRPQRPDMRVVYMSGYAYEAVTQDGLLDRGEEFLAKPFTMRTLLEALRQPATA